MTRKLFIEHGEISFVLSLAPIDAAKNIGFVVINAHDRQVVEEVIPKLREDFQRQLPDVEARLFSMLIGPSDPNVLQVQMKGPDAVYIQEQSKNLEKHQSMLNDKLNMQFLQLEEKTDQLLKTIVEFAVDNLTLKLRQKNRKENQIPND